MTDYEKLGAFYLGRSYDMAARQPRQDLLLYDSRDLVTHGVCFGMTGSGKTGLCAVLLEEAAIDGIPALVIDPKGDLANLLLAFPNLDPADFRPWVSEDAARQKGLTPEDYAVEQASLWRRGLAGWNQQPERIARLRESADFTVYTPGSEAGVPIALLNSFDPPPPEVREDRELFREHLGATVSSLLGLLRIDADPISSREHILVSLLLERAWREGRGIDLAGLIGQLQHPPVERVGVLELEAFYPARDRFALAMQLNGILASPGFEAWREGEPLDIDRLLFTAAGKPRVSIFSIAHLGDAERMFFVSLLLNQTLTWMRKQPGTTSLRALVYMDEIYGYFPPVSNPPSKTPLMTLLKQGRAFGLGVLLATQNPVDLDYKGLGNAGTWFIGRLQTDRDQSRVLDGLAGAAAGTGRPFDRGAMERTIAGLGKRVFLMYNVHDDAPEIFETRWALSYLCGPLTRQQIRTLMAERKATEAPPGQPTTLPEPAAAGSSPSIEPAAGVRPGLPAEVVQVFARAEVPASPGAQLCYEPVLYGRGRLHYLDPRAGIDRIDEVAVTAPLEDTVSPVDWGRSRRTGLSPADLDRQPQPGAFFGALPGAMARIRALTPYARDLAQWLYQENPLTLFRAAALRELSQPGESERDFRIRLELLAREHRDAQVERLRAKYAPRLDKAREQIERAEIRLAREQEQAQRQRFQSTVSVGTSLLGALFGRRTLSASTLRRAGTATRAIDRARKESSDVGRATQELDRLEQRFAELEEEFEREAEAVAAAADPRFVEFETVSLRPRKGDIDVTLVALLWLPWWHDRSGARTPAWHA